MNDFIKMKRTIVVLLFFFALCVINAQNKQRHITPERFQAAELEQYITKKAGLTPVEASKFFPIYSEMLRKQRAIHDEIKTLKRIKPLTDAECKQNILKRDQYEIEIKIYKEPITRSL